MITHSKNLVVIVPVATSLFFFIVYFIRFSKLEKQAREHRKLLDLLEVMQSATGKDEVQTHATVIEPEMEIEVMAYPAAPSPEIHYGHA